MKEMQNAVVNVLSLQQSSQSKEDDLEESKRGNGMSLGPGIDAFKERSQQAAAMGLVN